jgi:hypothetical protein
MLSFGDYVNGLNDNACCQCGRKTGKNSWFVQLSIYGAILDPKIAVEGNPKSQGYWAVGSECAKKFNRAVLVK